MKRFPGRPAGGRTKPRWLVLGAMALDDSTVEGREAGDSVWHPGGQGLGRPWGRTRRRTCLASVTLSNGQALRPWPGLTDHEPADLARHALRAGVRGVIVVRDIQRCDDGRLADQLAADAVLDALLAAAPDLPVSFLLIDRRIGPLAAPLGCVGDQPDAVIGWVLDVVAARAMDELTVMGVAAGADDGVLLMPVRVAERQAAWTRTVDEALAAVPGMRFAGLHVAGASLLPIGMLLGTVMAAHWTVVSTPPVVRSRMPLIAGLSGGVAVLAVAAGSWWSVDAVTRQAVQNMAFLAQASGTDGLSPPALDALGEMVMTIQTGAARLPLVPASWSGGMDAILTDRTVDAIGPVMLDPVRQRIDALTADLTAGVEQFEAATGLPPQDLLTRAQTLLAQAVRIDRQGQQFRLVGGGGVHDQWQPLISKGLDGRAAPSLSWLETQAGATVFVTALREYGWQPPAVGVLATRVVAAVSTQASAGTMFVAEERRLRAAIDRLTVALDRLSSPEVLDEAVLADTLREATAASTALQGDGRRLANALSPLPDVSILEGVRAETVAAGLVPEETWRQATGRLTAAVQARSEDLAGLEGPHVGPVFMLDRGTGLALSPAISTTDSALQDLATADFAAVPVSGMPDLGALAMRKGAPDPALVGRAGARLAAYQAWLATHEGKAPDGVLRPVATFVAFRAAAGAVMDVAAAYQKDATADQPVVLDDALAVEIVNLVSRLSEIDAGLAGEVAWLVGVRAYRQLESIDAAFESSNPFRFSPVVEGWTGQGPVLDVVGWRSAEERARRFREGLNRLQEGSRDVASLLTVLSARPVAAELTMPDLVGKWRVLVDVAANPEGPSAAGYKALKAMINNDLSRFDQERCSDVAALSGVSGLPDDPFVSEARRIIQGLMVRCGVLLQVPVPDPKPERVRSDKQIHIPW